MDRLAPEARTANMRAIRSKGMKPELLVRKIVHRMGYRYRLHRPDLPGRPDLVFPSRKKIIFVHGCFWHQHPSPNCRIVRKPKSNICYWTPKLAANRRRDAQHQFALQRDGWDVLTLWECELLDGNSIETRVRYFLNDT